jgi:hypothetical protein
VAAKSDDAALKGMLKEAAAGILRDYLKVDPGKVRITAAGLEIAK